MLLLAKVQLHDHPSVFGVAEFFAAIAAELSVRLCHKSFSAPLVSAAVPAKIILRFPPKRYRSALCF